MTWLSRLFGRASVPDAKAMDSAGLMRMLSGGSEAASGALVNETTALEVATVLACCRVIAEGVSQAPWCVMQEGADGAVQTLRGHSVSQSLKVSPDGVTPAFNFKETLVLHLLLCGNAYSIIDRAASGKILRIVNVEPNRVQPQYVGGKIDRYVITIDGDTPRSFAPRDVWHIRGPSWNGALGIRATQVARNAIGLAISTEKQAGAMAGRGMTINGVYSLESGLSPEKFRVLGAWLDQHAPGGERDGKPLILGDGAKWSSQQMTGVDAQHLETRRHQVEEICRAFRVMPLMVGHPADMAARAATESIFLQHVVHTLMPWYGRLEESADLALLSEQERAAGMYTRLDPTALMRGAAADRAAYYTAALGDTQRPGWMKKNEVRAKEGLPPVDGGDDFVPLITQPGENGGDNADA